MEASVARHYEYSCVFSAVLLSLRGDLLRVITDTVPPAIARRNGYMCYSYSFSQQEYSISAWECCIPRYNSTVLHVGFVGRQLLAVAFGRVHTSP